jgi:oxygen-independent coproporphyrinogen-3 oxidase
MFNLTSLFLRAGRWPATQELRNLAFDILSPDPAGRLQEDLRELRQRMEKPQRHRLLHGYPLAHATPRRADNLKQEDVSFDPRHGRALLVGVLPHPFCNPAVAGCGFCTFPHQPYHAGQAASVVERVLGEIEQRVRFQPALRGRVVEGLYFGGGTANLTPAEPFTKLCRRLSSTFDLTQAEVTLEGVPAYFVKRRPLLMDLLREAMAARHFRISMGIQTFDEEQLRRMGRLAFGTADTFREVVSKAHARGFTVSGDLLFNLPGQTLQQMRDDVARAADLGLDHLGLYHLVLFRGLGTAWSRDREQLARLPSNEQAAGHWLALRAFLLENGFDQTTLTNFERQKFRGHPARFIYEEKSYQPDRHEMIGFGPTGISFAADRAFTTAMKTLNPESAADYASAVERGTGPWDRSFAYQPHDLRILYLTRRLAALEIDRGAYRSLFGVDPLADFGREFRALARGGLVEETRRSLRPTPLGMFYADSIAALLAWRQVRSSRNAGRFASGAGRQSSVRLVALRQDRVDRNSNASGGM